MIKRSKIVRDNKNFYFFEISDGSEDFQINDIVISFLVDELVIEDDESVTHMGFYIKPVGEEYDKEASFLASYKRLKENPLTIKLPTFSCIYFHSILEYGNYLLLNIIQKFILFHLAKKINQSVTSQESNVFSEDISKALNICNTYSDILMNILNDKMDESSFEGAFGGKRCLN